MSRHASLAAAFALLAIVLVGAAFRYQVATGTVVDRPLRPDATDYYFYAYNLARHGVYSRQRTDPERAPTRPDFLRPPGYPLLLAPFVTYPPTLAMIRPVVFLQVVLSTLTLLAVYLAARLFAGVGIALGAAALTALSPHLAVMNVYLLSETLFTFVLAVHVAALLAAFVRRNAGLALLAGLALGAALLVRPTLSYWLPFLALGVLVLPLPRRRALGLFAWLVAGTLVAYGPWMAVRHLHADPAAKGLALTAIHNGIYPGLMVDGDPASRGYPHRADPHYRARDSLGKVLDELRDRVRKEPLRYLEWYLLGKPAMFFQWDMVVGAGDVFVYPVRVSVFDHDGPSTAVHRLMRLLHVPLVLLMAGVAVLAWLPGSFRGRPEGFRTALRLLSLLMLYFTLVHVAGTPLPRYAVPLRPYIYLLATIGVAALLRIPGRTNVSI